MNVMAVETGQRQNIPKKLKEMNNRPLTKNSVFDLRSCLVYAFGCTQELGARESSVTVIVNVSGINSVRNVYLQDSRTPQPSWLSLHSMSGA